MCGIAGICPAGHPGQEEIERLLLEMTQPLAHRGPDDSGTWVDAEAGVGLGFRRLSIIDTSMAGHQPMVSGCGRYVVVFNGEIYNHHDLRAEVGATAYRGHSDTESMLAAFTKWGVRQTLPKLNGMFAMAIWDREDRRLTLARDRMGEKPLYYGIVNGSLVFGSELKALSVAEGFSHEIDRDALTLFLRHGYVPAPRTIYTSFAKLPPATYLEFKGGKAGDVTAYWSAFEAAVSGVSNPFSGDEREALEELDRRLRAAVGMRLESDVPLGAFLSGGIDSSLVVALMQIQLKSAVSTFTIGFRESAWDEAPYAQRVAEHLGTKHTELYVTPREAQSVIPQLSSIYDEPFADSSQIPTFLVAQLARSRVTVSISGDGGDEIFGGYSRYPIVDNAWSRISRIPSPLRTVGSVAVGAVPPRSLDLALRLARPLAPGRLRGDRNGDKLRRLAQAMRSSDHLYLELISVWSDPERVVLNGHEPASALVSRNGLIGKPSTRAMYKDAITYLPDDILTKVDRASMAVSLESRAPLLDHTLYEFAWTLPRTMLLDDGEGKRLLRKVLWRYVPQHLVERPKQGFGVPVGEWLRGPLRSWAEDLLNPGTLKREGLLDVEIVRRTWKSHIAGHSDASHRLWTVLMLEAWLQRQSLAVGAAG